MFFKTGQKYKDSEGQEWAIRSPDSFKTIIMRNIETGEEKTISPDQLSYWLNHSDEAYSMRRAGYE